MSWEYNVYPFRVCASGHRVLRGRVAETGWQKHLLELKRRCVWFCSIAPVSSWGTELSFWPVWFSTGHFGRSISEPVCSDTMIVLWTLISPYYSSTNSKVTSSTTKSWIFVSLVDDSRNLHMSNHQYNGIGNRLRVRSISYYLWYFRKKNQWLLWVTCALIIL